MRKFVRGILIAVTSSVLLGMFSGCIVHHDHDHGDWHHDDDHHDWDHH